jgi:hypothetical protein
MMNAIPHGRRQKHDNPLNRTNLHLTHSVSIQ